MRKGRIHWPTVVAPWAAAVWEARGAQRRAEGSKARAMAAFEEAATRYAALDRPRDSTLPCSDASSREIVALIADASVESAKAARELMHRSRLLGERDRILSDAGTELIIKAVCIAPSLVEAPTVCFRPGCLSAISLVRSNA
jgi:hypothetical protein